MRAIALIWLALALLASACTPTLMGATAEVGAGQVQRLDGDDWVGVTRVGDGDHIRAVADASLDFGGELIRLGAGSEATVGDRAVILTVGDALAEGMTVAVGVQDAMVRGAGAFRVQAGVTPRVAVYAGEVQVIRPGEGQRIGALRELTLSSRRFDGVDQPLSYDPADPVDQRMVPDAIAFDAQIGNLVTAIDAQFGSSAQPAAFYTSFVSVSEPDLRTLTDTAPTVTADGAVGPPADALVGLFMARAAADARDGDLVRAAADIRRLRNEGARWGLIGMILGVTGVAFAGIVDRAVERRDVAAATPEAPVADAPPAGGPAVISPAPADPGPTAEPPPAAPPPPQPEVPPSTPPPVDAGTVGEVLEDVLDLLPDGLGLVSASD